jgi:hypothetical protein
MTEILYRQNSAAIYFFTKFILFRYKTSADNFQRALADESGMIRKQMETKINHKWSQCEGRLPRPPHEDKRQFDHHTSDEEPG